MNTVEAISYGPEVRSLLTAGGGRVLALLSNAVYLESFEGYVVGIVGEGAVDGPLGLRVRDLAGLIARLRGRLYLPFRCDEGVIDVGGPACISLHGAHEWRPRPPERLGAPDARDEAARALVETILAYDVGQAPGGSGGSTLAHLVRLCHSERSEESHPRTEKYGERFFAALRMTREMWHSEARSGTPNDYVVARVAERIIEVADGLRLGDLGGAAGGAMASLIGLGVGLTPSGDDFVSGIIAALVWQARLGALASEVPEEIIARVQMAAARTNRISERMLHYAGEGVLYAPAMQLGAALLAGDARSVGGPARRLFEIGNTSGVDLATGLLVGCLVAGVVG